MTEWTIRTLKEHFDKILEERSKALDLQASEYSRRLDELNHAHERAEKERGTFLRQDTFNEAQKAEGLARELAAQQTFDRLASLERFRAQASVLGVVAVFAGGVIGAAIMRALGG